ncbi:hypothetical protein GCM10022215_30960 [Nocardioides fonticola]|uniref:Uncharacterized protein n=1 Tax=Nocardioides fonticola TaxID=450363 RepID=A0ABP7XR54_9ACTN
MRSQKMTGEIVQVWISVPDAEGRSHLESRWVTPEIAAQLHTTYAA